MLGSDRVHLALALAAAAAVAAGCSGGPTTEGTGGKGGEGGSTMTTGGTGGTTTSSSSTGGTGGGLECPSGDGPVLAVSQLGFGEGDNGEWKSVGFNVDGLVSTIASIDVCQPYNGAAKSGPYPDGDDGIDNSFGKNLLPIILSLYMTWVSDVNNNIDKGNFTTLLKMECLPPTGDVPKFNSKLFGGTNLGMNPLWDGTDKWPVTPELLSDPMDPLSSTIIFGASSVTGNVFDTGKGQTFILTVPLKTMTDSTSIKLSLYAARTTMTLADDRKSATNGIIGGVLNTEEVVNEIKKIGYITNLCGQTLDNLLEQVREASDIMSDGTQDPSKTCDGISIGLKFDMSEAQIGSVGMPAPKGMTCP